MDNIIRFASDSGETFTFLRPQMESGQMFMSAGIVMLVVFGVLFLMYVLISLAGKVIAGISGSSKKAEVKAPAAAPVKVEEAVEDPGEEFSSGSLKLKGCDEKTAAMIMAIVSDNTGIPLSELVFKSIKLVDEN